MNPMHSLRVPAILSVFYIAIMIHATNAVEHSHETETETQTSLSSSSGTFTYSNAAMKMPEVSSLLSTEDEMDTPMPMPMHRRFLQERRRLYNLKSNYDVVVESKEVLISPIRVRNEASKENVYEYYHHYHSRKNKKNGNRNRNRNRNLDNNNKDNDVLSANWWFQLSEGQRKPETRRSHAATVYSIGGSDEFMVITGGFSDSDSDKTTFPVWAYDMTQAILYEDGRWYELTPPTPTPTPMTDENENENENGPHQKYKYCVEFNATAVPVAVDPAKGWGDENSVAPCGPTARVGHISLVRHGYLYVFGGLQYTYNDDKEGAFFMEDENPYMYRMKLNNSKLGYEDEDSYSHVDLDSMNFNWQRIMTNVIPPTNGTCTLRLNEKDCVVNRGDVRGGYWEQEDKWIIYGGLLKLKVKEYEQQSDTTRTLTRTLGDVWAYDFKSFTWEMLSTPPNPDSDASGEIEMEMEMELYPPERTSHAATVVGDELLVYGGMKLKQKKDATHSHSHSHPQDGTRTTMIWEQLDDVWVFNLRSRKWRQRLMEQSEGRSYHSVVGWERQDDENGGSVLTTFGGSTIMMDPAVGDDNDNGNHHHHHPGVVVSEVYDDVLLSLPPKSNSTAPSSRPWYEAYSFYHFETMISKRLEHTAVLSPQYPNMMIVWGGRYHSTNDVDGVWSLYMGNGKGIRGLDDNFALEDIWFIFILLFFVMVMIICGIIRRRRLENEEADSDSSGDVVTPSPAPAPAPAPAPVDVTFTRPGQVNEIQNET